MSCWHLWAWYGRNRFCGRCAHPLVPDAAERALRCEGCGLVVYPAIAPAVIVAITRGDSILLARSVRSTFRHYSLISGYVEVGETLEHAVRREVMEEVGLRLGALRYLGDQPWGVSGSQMFAFQAEALDGGIRLLKRGQKGVVHAIFSRVGLVLVLLLLQAFALFSLLQWFGELLPHYFGGTLLVTAAMMVYLHQK